MAGVTGTPDVIFPNIGIVIHNLNRVAFSFFGFFDIYWYGIFIALGIAAGYYAAAREMKRIGENPDILLDLLFFGLIFSLIGARLYYVVFSWDLYKNDLLSVFNTRGGGLAIYGGVLAALATAFVFAKIRKIPFWRLTDVCVFGLLAGQILGRLGNFFNREAFGGYTNGLFAMRYLKETVQFDPLPRQVLDNIVTLNGAAYIQVQPTFLYEMLWNIGVLCFLNAYKKRKRFDGELTALYFMGYGVGRFWIEGLRSDQLRLFGTGLAVSQLLSAVMIVLSVAFLFYMRRGNRSATEFQKNID